MRAERKAEEEFFVQKFMDYFRAEIDEFVPKGKLLEWNFHNFQASISLKIFIKSCRHQSIQKIK